MARKDNLSPAYFLHMILPVLCISVIISSCSPKQGNGISGEVYTDISYGEGIISNNYKQLLDLYQAPSDQPSPVYIWAHGNNRNFKYTNDLFRLIDPMAEGISVVSWESVVLIDTEDAVAKVLETQTMWRDSIKVYTWVTNNAEAYNLDTNNIFVGGFSRGSWAGWDLAHSGLPGIRGVYYIGANVDVDLFFSPPYEGKSFCSNFITVNSPPISMVYSTYQEFSEPGLPHSPSFGIDITNVYHSLGIGSKTRVVRGESFANLYDYLIDFILTNVD
jgi:pimeloyl-ACP methyl ester carboxylesterase